MVQRRTLLRANVLLESSGTDCKHRAVCSRDDLMCHGGKVRGANKATSFSYSEHDQVGALSLRRLKNLLSGRALKHNRLGFAPEFSIASDQNTKLVVSSLFQFV